MKGYNVRRTIAALAAWLLFATAAVAQSPTVTKGISSATAPNDSVSLSVRGFGAVGIQVTGTFTGTLTFEGTLDGVTYTTLQVIPYNTTVAVTTTTGTGMWGGAIGGMSIFRVRMSSYTSGTANVTINASVQGVASRKSPFDQGLNTTDSPTLASISATNPAVTAGSGTGITVDTAGEIRQEVYKVTVAYTNFIANATTADVTLATLPAKTFATHLLADLVTPFVCAAVCTTATLSMTCGTSAGGNQYLLTFDLDAAAAVFGDAAAELGASINPATVPTINGALGSWASTATAQCRVTSAVGEVGNGTATNFNAGSLTFYLTTVKMP